ncbi:PrgI family protein [Patescibacteria group bacterium]|nr:PrgI family protein [Patescibacteria group bacterium]
MQFLVPQFIDVEPKIIGPISPRQFVVFIVTLLLCVLAYKLADFALFTIEAIIFVAVGGSFMFLKVNGQPLHYFLLNIGNSFKKPNLRVWKKQTKMPVEIKVKEKKKDKGPIVVRKSLPSTRLSQISLMVDTGGKYNEEDFEE